MKKLALLIGNSRGLAGSSQDMQDFYTHLTSLQGGAWDPSTEIMPLLDESSSKILDTLSGIRGLYQYVMIYFTGHGGTCNGTILEVNPQNEQLNESEFLGLAPKQLNILDCCRSFVRGAVPIYDSHDSVAEDVLLQVRQEFDQLIEDAAEQQVLIYSCEEGKPSYALRGGSSIFSKCLLEASATLLQSNDVVKIYDTFTLAEINTKANANRLRVEQNPEIVPAKCLSSLELPFCFNPQCLKEKNG